MREIEGIRQRDRHRDRKRERQRERERVRWRQREVKIWIVSIGNIFNEYVLRIERNFNALRYSV